jgi:hypothetical protein
VSPTGGLNTSALPAWTAGAGRIERPLAPATPASKTLGPKHEVRDYMLTKVNGIAIPRLSPEMA